MLLKNNLMIIFFVDQNLKKLPLSEILDIEKLNNVDKSIEVANGLPNECYTNANYLAHEREKISFNKWTVFICRCCVKNNSQLQELLSQTLKFIVSVKYPYHKSSGTI